MNEELFTPEEAAFRLKVHKNTIHNWLRDGIFPNAIRVKSIIRIPLSDIQALKQPSHLAKKPSRKAL